MDALLLAEIDNLLLRKAWVVLDLVDCRHDGSMWQELLQVSLAVIGDTDSFDFPGAHQLLHVLPGIDVGAIEPEITRPICELWEQFVRTWIRRF